MPILDDLQNENGKSTGLSIHFQSAKVSHSKFPSRPIYFIEEGGYNDSKKPLMMHTDTEQCMVYLSGTKGVSMETTETPLNPPLNITLDYSTRQLINLLWASSKPVTYLKKQITVTHLWN